MGYAETPSVTHPKTKVARRNALAFPSRTALVRYQSAKRNTTCYNLSRSIMCPCQNVFLHIQAQMKDPPRGYHIAKLQGSLRRWHNFHRVHDRISIPSQLLHVFIKLLTGPSLLMTVPSSITIHKATWNFSGTRSRGSW
jgi:hypothetical protein